MSQQLPTPQLLNQISQFIQNQKNKNYFYLFLLGSQSGLRVSEAVNFDLSLKKGQNLYLIQGKRHKKRTIYVSPTVIRELKKNNWQPQQTNRFSFAHYLQKVKRDLNISPNIELTPHTLRRCFATYQAISGMPLPTLQKVLGHASIRTTALYWKEANTPQEKEYIRQWLAGKKPSKKLKIKVFINIQQEVNIFVPNKENSDCQLLETKNQILQDETNSLTQELVCRDKTIAELQKELKKAFNDKQQAEAQLISEQAKSQQLEFLLKAEQDKVAVLVKQKQEKFSSDNQLIAQIEIPVKK